MIVEHRRRKSSSVTFSVPDDHYHPQYYAQRTASFAESDLDYEPTITTISPTAAVMARAFRSVKTFKKSWDSDKALKSTYEGKFGKHQLRAYIFLALGYAVIAAWLAKMPTFALLPPKYVECQPYYPSIANSTVVNSTAGNETGILRKGTSMLTNKNQYVSLENGTRLIIKPIYNYSREYGRSVFTDFEIFCDKFREKLPYVFYIIGLILGGLVFGCIADHSGRKMILLGSMWTACVLSLFQLLSDDYISYVFFIFFVGVAIGAVQVIAVPFVIEMFPTETRAIYGLSLTGIAFLFDLILPGLAYAVLNWKILQGIISIPLIFTAMLYWFSEESMFWHTTQKDHITAVMSLTNIARFNGVDFEDKFREARDFLRGKRSKGIQCDFQPLLRLEDIRSLGSKYPDFDMVDLQATTSKRNTFSQRCIEVVTGHHYYPTLSTFYPTDYLHSPILTLYLLIMCGLWLVSSLTEYSLDSAHLRDHLTTNFFLDYFYTHLIQVGSYLVAFPMVYRWGRRWPTFCFFLIAEVCLLGSFAVRSDTDDGRIATLVVYFMGKFASRGGFIVILLYTCEIFPTGLRCTTLGICYTFRWIGIALASENLAGLNDRMPRLIYGILSLVLGSMALLLPETRKFPLPRTMVQIEVIPTSISKKCRRNRSLPLKRNARPDDTRPAGGAPFNDAASSVSGVRSVRFGPYDNQSTMHSVYELQEFGQDDTIYSQAGRNPRRMDLRNPALFQPFGAGHNETYRPQQPIAEEFGEDFDDDRTHHAHQRLSKPPQPMAADRRADDAGADGTNAGANKQSFNDLSSSSQVEVAAQVQTGDETADRNGSTAQINDEAKQGENGSQSSTRAPDETRTYPPAISEDENYFSEHC